MNTISRGVRNAFRNVIRTFSIVIILGISIGLALAMLVARASVEDKINTVKTTIGNTISVSPAGSQGFQGGGEPLTNDQLTKVSQLANVTGVVETISDRLTTSNTNLVSAVEAGSLGQRGADNSGVGFQAPPAGEGTGNRQGGTGTTGTGTGTVTRTFTPPVTLTGTNNATDKTVYSGNAVNITSGTNIDASKDADVAIVGTTLAAKNNLTVGSTFTAYGSTITVAGIFDTGNTFANNGVVMSLPTVQRLSSQVGDVTSATVLVNSIDNIDTVTTAVKASLGTAADVTNNQETAKTAIEPLESVKTISTYSLIGAVIAGGVIILLTMVMIVRERRREIGVFKAIGASNIKVMFQFMAEAVTLTVLGMIAGLIIGAAAASPVTKVLVNNSTSTSQTATTQGGPGGGQRANRGIAGNTLTNAKNVKASVGLSIIAYGFGTAIVIAIIGSALPALLISKVRPAEVMRAE